MNTGRKEGKKEERNGWKEGEGGSDGGRVDKLITA